MFDCANMSIAAAQLLEQGHLVSIFHGKAEAGPRALGNRSILFDPRKINGKDIVNSVKMREYFRPFAFTMMAEYANEWFYMNDLQESPFMMYAVKVKEQYKNRIPAVIHVDNTCRIQTVKKEQNPILYELLSEFYKKTDIPGVLNTSFNLAGDPIVETIEDALNTLRRSQLEYLFLPEIKKMIFIQNYEYCEKT
jgi:carbamoyltransferase